MSESQERMCAVVEPAKLDAFLAICAQVGRHATVIGEVTDGDRLDDRLARRDDRRRPAAHRRPRGPGLRAAVRPARRAGRAAGRRAAADGCRGRRPATSCAPRCSGWSASPNLAAKTWVTDAVRPLRARQHRARPARGRRRGPRRRGDRPRASRSPPTATAASPSSTRTPARSSPSPRPTATSRSTGATPLAVTNCLNFGSPEDPDVMWQFAEADARPRRRLPRARHPGHRRQRQLLQPDRRRRAINPTPGRRRARCASTTSRRRTPMGFRGRRRRCLLLGETRDELGGSEWAHVVHGHLGGLPPRVDLGARAARSREVLVAGAARRPARRRARPVRRRPRARRSSRWRCGARSPARSTSTAISA